MFHGILAGTQNMNETIRAARMLTCGRWKVICGMCLAVSTLMKPSHIMAVKRKRWGTFWPNA